ncbi:MAG TPA: FAD:protein FMN transferase [Anaerohalosphaeraceae bacterium]|nr:FAD:protein FMN transferase [Anaerohalosphaeraceae bacterium]HOL89585.1 FAD:protein FMN transferase [Anaerohalosphaeraceae bacterium]HPP55569.1 FAD:protein FMN transferase [Anaerohalosphaeraceae bacterium]
MKPFHFCHRAMATEFELFIEYPDSTYAANAARAAFDELDRLESLLSRFISNSDISRINSLQKGQSVIVSPETMECLQIAWRLYKETGGLFDCTVGGLVDLWKGTTPSEGDIRDRLCSIGMHLLEIRPDRMSIRVHTEGIRLDFGGLGKGFAVKKMADVLGEWQIKRALIHGGTSTILAMDAPSDQVGWPVRLTNPITQKEIRTLLMRDESLSCSGLRRGTDMIRPVSGQAIQDKSAVWVKGENPAVCDGISTAVMVMTREEIERFGRENPSLGILILLKEKPTQEPLQFGSW